MFSKLDSDAAYWLSFWSLVALVLVALVIGVSATFIHSNATSAETVRMLAARGASPQEIKCLIEDLNSKPTLAVMCAQIKPAATAASQ